MQQNNLINDIADDITTFFAQPNALRSILILIISLVIAYWLSRFLASGIVKFAQIISNKGDEEPDDQRVLRYRQIETYLSITVAVVRALVALVLGFFAWEYLSPISSNGAAAIGAGTVFLVVAGQTLGMILRDITAGTVMITERWFTVGDYIKVEPYWDVSGVVERFTLRSTRIRSLSGEIIWMHNQNITGVHVTPKGVRTMAVDVFVRNKEEGEKAIKKIVSAMPKGKTTMAKALKIVETEQWGESRWRITVLGQTAPGREWLIEKFFVEAVMDLDEGKKASEKLIALPPMPRYADEIADKRFKRAVRVASEKKHEDL